MPLSSGGSSKATRGRAGAGAGAASTGDEGRDTDGERGGDATSLGLVEVLLLLLMIVAGETAEAFFQFRGGLTRPEEMVGGIFDEGAKTCAVAPMCSSV